MPASNDIVDQLFEKARTTAPVVSINELKDTLKNAPAKPFLYSHTWLYISLSCLIGLVTLLTWYGSEHSKENKVKQYIPMQENSMIRDKVQGALAKEKAIDSIQKVSPKKNVTPALSNNSMIAATIITDSILPINTSSGLISSFKTDSIKQDTTTKPQDKVHVASAEIKTSGLVIYTFSNLEKIKLYQKRLAEANIRFDITEMEYDKKYHENITVLSADMYIHDTLYKSIHIKDFKELRIQWEIDHSGTTRIKSISILDQFYMLKKL